MVQHVLVAPDKFKGSLTAAEVAATVAAALSDPALRVSADASAGGPATASAGGPAGSSVGAGASDLVGAPVSFPVVELPVADGGDGTVDAAVAAGFDRVTVQVTGPTGEPVAASYARRGGTAVVELAEASGLRRLPGGPEPLTATSHGTGELIADAVKQGATRVVLGLGGSACTDGGAGMVQALGARLLDAAGRELPRGGAALRDLDRVDVSGFLDVSGVAFVVASDVDNPLLGPHGAAAVYGPQKGATPEQVKLLDAALGRFAAVATRTHGLAGAVEHDDTPRAMGVAGAPGAGAAGGVGFAALAFLHAGIRPGIDYLLDLLGFPGHVNNARLVITGEGSLDEQTLRGKAPAGVARAAAAAGVPVVAVCGRRTLTDDQLREAGIEAAYALTDLEPDPARCMAEARPLLTRLTARLAAERLV